MSLEIKNQKTIEEVIPTRSLATQVYAIKLPSDDAGQTVFKVRTTLNPEQIGTGPWQTQYNSTSDPKIPSGALVYVLPEEQIKSLLKKEDANIAYTGLSLIVRKTNEAFSTTTETFLDNCVSLDPYSQYGDGLFLKQNSIAYNLNFIDGTYFFTVFDNSSETIINTNGLKPYPVSNQVQALNAGCIIELTYVIND